MAKILVVEDSSVDRVLVGGLLGKEPTWEIEFANDGLEGLARIHRGNPQAIEPDVIVTDLQMPNMDGLELVRNVRLTHCLLYTSPSPRDRTRSRMPSSA